MANLAPFGVQAGADASVSDLLAHWIAEQQQRDVLCLRERPRIGILAACGHLRDGGWPSYSGDAPTVQAILEAGGFPSLIPTLPLIEGYDPLQLLSDDHAFALLFGVLWPVVRELDGLILTGGGDLSSCLFGKPPHPQTETPDAWRDVWERYIALLAWLLCIPTLGICRGMQLMNVALGGTLSQDLRAEWPKERPPLLRHRARGRVSSSNWVSHPIQLARPDSRLAMAVRGRGTLDRPYLDAVLSMHHQAVEELAPGLEVAAASPDGVIEAFEETIAARWWVGVQFHPEWMTQFNWALGLFTALIDASRGYTAVPRDEIETLLDEIRAWLRQHDRALNADAVPFALMDQTQSGELRPVLTLQRNVVYSLAPSDRKESLRNAGTSRWEIRTFIHNEEIRIMRRTHVTEQMIDPVIGRRIFTLCWFCAGLGVSILQMQLLAQAWSVSRQALTPACIVSVWVLGSLVGSRRRTTTGLWVGCLLACTLLWCVGTRLVSWRIGLVPTTWLSDGALIASAALLGTMSTAWLVQRRPWPAPGERAALARGLLGTTAGLFTVWVLPAWAGLIALSCLIPLLALDGRPAGRSSLPAIGSVVENWVSRYWNPERWQVQLEVRSLPRNWWWSYLATRSQDSRGYVPLTLLASGSAVILGAIWGAVPTPFAAGLDGMHELGKLGWLLGGQIVALAIGACCVLVARNVVGFSDRVVPPSWQARVFALALSMLAILAGSLVTLGLPFLQAPWWLAFSLASYTLAGAIWGLLLPRLRPSFTTLVVAQRHRWLGQDRGMTEPLHLAHGRAQEERLTRLFATTEGMLIAICTPVVGLLIDLYGSVDRVLVIIGLFFLLGLTLLALISVLRSLKHSQHTQFARSAMRDRPTHSWRPGYNLVRPGLAW